MSKMEDFDFINEKSFRRKLPRLYKLIAAEGVRLGIGLDLYDFVYAEGIGDLIDIQYTNGEKDFYVSVKGGDRHGYKILYSNLTDAIDDDIDGIEDDQEW